MVMIPIDVGVQVRSQTDESLHPLRPIAEIPADLPDLQQGQLFRARIQEVLPENTYKALVAGQSLTLSLPEGAKTGDILELVVIDRTPRTLVAQRAQRDSATPVEQYQHAVLSRTGQLIASLLAGEGEAAVPATLARGRPLMAQAPASGGELATRLPPQLAQAVTSSGLFYEAHQAQWVLGLRPLASLLAEPQGLHSRAEALAAWGGEGSEEAVQAESALAGRRDSAVNATPSSPLRTLFGGERVAEGAPLAESYMPANQSAAAVMIPDDLRPLVQQQLEAAATQRLAWHGDIWPEQPMDWEIEREASQGHGEAGEPAGWHTRVRLALPRLGEIDAGLRLSGQAVQLVLRTADAGSAASLQGAIPVLQQALAGVDLALLGVQVVHDQG